jgi:hypothetical protein
VLFLRADGTASGVFLLNSNGMDVKLQQTAQASGKPKQQSVGTPG